MYMCMRACARVCVCVCARAWKLCDMQIRMISKPSLRTTFAPGGGGAADAVG